MNARQRVDPFMPIRPAQKHKPLAGQYGTQWLRKPSDSQPPVSKSNPASTDMAEHSATTLHPTRPKLSRSIEGISRTPISPVHPTPQRTLPIHQPITPRFSKPTRPPEAIAPKRPVDDMRPAGPAIPRHEHTTTPSPSPTAVHPYSQPLADTAAKATLDKKRPRFVRLLQKAQLVGVLLVAIVIGLLAQSLVFGELVIGVYAIFALTRRISSQTTFLLALIALVAIVLLLALNADSDIANNFAVYAFLLLTVGTVSLGIEVHREA